MIYLQNRKMPSLGAAWGFLGLSSLLALLLCLQPTALMLVVLSVCFASAGLLSIPKITYPKVLLLALAAGLLPAAIGFLLAGSIPSAIVAFSFAPAVLLLVLSVRRHWSRSTGINWITAILVPIYPAALLLQLYLEKGSLSFKLFKELYSTAKASYLEYSALAFEQNPQLAEQLGLSQESLPQIFDTTLALLPGFYIMVIWVMAWLTTVCLRWIFKSYVYGARRFAQWPVTMTRPAAWLFLLAFIAAALPLMGNWSIVPIVGNNICFILMPGFVIIGCRAIKEQMTHLPGCGCLPIVLLALFSLFISGPLMLLAMMGAFRTVAPMRPVQMPPRNDSQNPYDPQPPQDQGGNPQ